MPSPRKPIHRTDTLPHGFLYRPDFISEDEHRELLRSFATLAFKNAEYKEYIAQRRTVAFGLQYSFQSRETTPGPPLPTFLIPIRAKVVELLPGILPEDFVEIIVTEYAPGAAIGWHRDVPQFGIVYGVSLASSCRLRLRLPTSDAYKLASIELAPRSAYIFQGEARWRWQHSIPAVAALRYSITFRTLRTR